MRYNFDQEIDRRGTNSYKWDSRNDIPRDTIPLWVADMDFKAAPAILDALRQKIDFGVFGYTFVPDEYFKAITDWFDRRHHWHITREEVIYTIGVVPAISATIKALARPNDKVLIMTPVYNLFFTSIRNNKCRVSESALKIVDNRYTIDFDDLEHKAADPDCTLLILCNPHNPGGRVWSRDELSKVAEICRKNNVIVISDEIHNELVFGGKTYTPFATVAGDCRWVSCISPSKSFNIAGLQIANIVAPDAGIRAKIDRAINDNEVCDVNPFGVAALIAAYDKSLDWLEDLLAYLEGNYRMLRERFADALPELPVMHMEGTYLAWVDCRRLGIPSEELEEILIKEAGVWLNAGSMYGKDGEGFMRVNMACPRTRLEKALDRLIPALKKLLPDS